MKKLFILLLSLSIAALAFGQPQNQKKQGPGKPDFERIRAERVAFITSEVGLTAAEAEKFWPVYNKIDEEQRALRKAENQAAKALKKAIAEGQDTEALLDEYLKAKEANVNLHIRAADQYKMILPPEKVAKFFTCDEQFLRRQLGKLQGPGNKGYRARPDGQGRQGGQGAEGQGHGGQGFSGQCPGNSHFAPLRAIRK